MTWSMLWSTACLRGWRIKKRKKILAAGIYLSFTHKTQKKLLLVLCYKRLPVTRPTASGSVSLWWRVIHELTALVMLKRAVRWRPSFKNKLQKLLFPGAECCLWVFFHRAWQLVSLCTIRVKSSLLRTELERRSGMSCDGMPRWRQQWLILVGRSETK